MARPILSVGVEVPGGEIERVDSHSRRSLLDADIILFSPEVPYSYTSENYLGKPCLSDDSSFQAREALAHWRRELAAAVDAGRLVVVFLNDPVDVFAAKGRIEYSGTGRNARKTRIVDGLNSYDALPFKCKAYAASGNEMVVAPDARYFAAYWSEFAKHSTYEAYLEGEFSDTLVKTRAGGRVVGACVRKGRGAALLIPALDLEQDNFLEYRKSGEKEEAYWTKDAEIFGKKMVSAFVAIAEMLASEVSATPAPTWSQDDAFVLPEEADLRREIGNLTSELVALDERRRTLEIRLESAGTLRGLLYEQGKPLEAAVLEALRYLGFDAKGFKDESSEFDAVITSPEGRFIGEVEGKDNRAINIDKFSQLERNLNEDFARDGVEEFAKGILFGNAYRLRPIHEREDSFTKKCRTGAARLGVALINTSDLFAPARYLKSAKDSEYAKNCRLAILKTSGDVVKFPAPPVAPQVETRGEQNVDGAA